MYRQEYFIDDGNWRIDHQSFVLSRTRQRRPSGGGTIIIELIVAATSRRYSPDIPAMIRTMCFAPRRNSST